MSKEIVLTGITTTGTPHLGNYVGAIRPAIEASRNQDVQSFYFLADYHSLIKCHDPERVNHSSMEVAAAWLALGLDADNAIFYRQSEARDSIRSTTQSWRVRALDCSAYGSVPVEWEGIWRLKACRVRAAAFR